MKKTIFQLETLTCPSCVKRIEGSLVKQAGVSNVVVKFNASKVEVDYDEALITAQMIKDVIVKVGYDVLSSK